MASPSPPLALKPNDALDIWRRALVDTMRSDGPDLSTRQMAIMLTVYLTPPPHTVRGLAAGLKVSKPAVSRALDRLSLLGYLRRKIDKDDRRTVLVQRTVKGSVFLTEFGETIASAAETRTAETGTAVARTRGTTAIPAE